MTDFMSVRKKNNVYVVLIVILVLLIGVSLFMVACSNNKEDENSKLQPEEGRMQSICEMVTAECYFHNVAKYRMENVSGFLWWKKDKHFWVRYEGIVAIGIDSGKLKMEVDGENVTVYIPMAKVLYAKVNDATLTRDSFIVEKGTVEPTSEDEILAFAEAQAIMGEKAAGNTALLSRATETAKGLIKGYVDSIGEATGVNYRVNFVTIPDESDTSGSYVMQIEEEIEGGKNEEMDG